MPARPSKRSTSKNLNRNSSNANDDDDVNNITTNSNKNDEDNDQKKVHTAAGTDLISQEVVSMARKALFRAVEDGGGGDEDDDNSINDGDDKDNNSNGLYSTKFILRLFDKKNRSSNNTGTSYYMIPDISSAREQRKILFYTLQYDFEKRHARRFFSGLNNMLSHVIEQRSYITTDANEEEEVDEYSEEMEFDQGHNNAVKAEKAIDQKNIDALKFLYYSTEAIQAYLNGLCDKQDSKKTRVAVCSEVYDVAVQLHSVLFDLSNYCCHPNNTIAIATQQKIVTLLENWWLNNASHRDTVIINALPVLVQAADGVAFEPTAIKRLYSIRSAIKEVDFTDPVSDSFLKILLRVVSSDACLRVSEGRKFLAYLFQVDKTLMNKLHQSIRVQIPSNEATILKAHGEIYFRAWKTMQETAEEEEDEDNVSESTTPTRTEFESHVLQDLMYAAVHVANPTMRKSLMTVLEPFHCSNKDTDVEALLHRTYGPILWRSLAATNAVVRVNATHIFMQVFPLQDPSHLHTDQVILKRCSVLQDLLKDIDPRVRIAASEATAQILSTFWEVIQPKEIRSILNHLMQHASDTASAAVRAGALEAVTLLLEATPSSHGVLRPLLPKLGNLIHDKVSRVRVACVRMLHCIKKIPGIQYFHVVPVDHLTARLAADGQKVPRNTVTSLLTSLMLNSYHPQNMEDFQQIKRTIKFLKTDPAAARVFYANVRDHLPVTSVAKLAAMLFRYVYASVETEQRLEEKKSKALVGKNKRLRYEQAETSDDEDGKDNDDASTTSSRVKTSNLADVAETICILWQSIEKQLMKNEECNKFLLEEFSGPMLTNALSHFEKKAMAVEPSTDHPASESEKEDCYRTCAAILRCAGRLPLKAVEGLVPHISTLLNSFADEDTKDYKSVENVTPHIALLCLWGMTDDVAASIATSIESAFENDHELLFASPSSDSKKRKSGRKSKKTSGATSLTLPLLPAHVSLTVLGDILRGSDPSSVAARESILTSQTACHHIEKALERGTRHAEKALAADQGYAQSIRESDVTFIISVCECFGRFILHKEALTNGDRAFSVQAERLLHWTTLKVVPVFSRTGLASDPFSELNISSIAVEQSFLGYSPVSTGPPRRRMNLSRTPSRPGTTESQVCVDTTTNIEDQENAASHFLSRAVAVALIHSSCVIFAEWLAVGCAGATAIAKAAIDWCNVFDSRTSSDLETETELLLPALVRLAVQLFRGVSDTSLLRELLLKCKADDDITGDDTTSTIMKSAISSILSSSRSASNNEKSMISLLVECVLNAAHEGVSDETNLPSDDLESTHHDQVLPSSVRELLVTSNGSCVRSALEAMFDHRKARLELAKQLIQNLKDKKAANGIADINNKFDETILVFDAKCLWLLCAGTSGEDERENEIATEVTRLIQHELGDTFKTENEEVCTDLFFGRIMNEIRTAVLGTS